MRGRRPRPLDDGGLHVAALEQRSETLPKLECRTKSGPWWGGSAGVLGLEPRTTGPEPAVLPITPYPMGVSVRPPCDRPDHHVSPCRTDPERYTRGGGTAKTGSPPAGGNAPPTGGPVVDQAHRPRHPRREAAGRPGTGSASRGSPPACRPSALSAVVMSPNVSASPKARKLLSTCIAMPASRPAGADDEDAGDDAEGEAVEEDRRSPATGRGTSAKISARPSTASACDAWLAHTSDAEGLGEVAAEQRTPPPRPGAGSGAG